MPGHLLGVFEPSVVFQVNRDAGRPPGVTSDGGQKTRRLGSFPEIAARALYRFSARPVTAVPTKITLWNRAVRSEGPAATMSRSRSARAGDARAFGSLPPFSPARAVMIVIIDFEFQHRAHTGKAVSDSLTNYRCKKCGS